MLHPQARALLDLMIERGVPPTHTLSVAEARRFYRERRHITQPEPPPIDTVRALTAEGPHGPIPLRLYRHGPNTGPSPVLVYFHGGGFTVGSVAMGFAEVTGLTRQYETLTYRHGLSFAEGEQIVRWRIDQFSDMTLRRGVVQGMPELREWLESGELRNLTVSLCDAEGTPVVSWRVQKALPVKLDAPALQADSGLLGGQQ